ncbi:putative leucine-rich repeat-containing protein DDB_G0290503 [Drosophila tropicalis]|uniref:putative leucine-rich repeat-containing protein DDB_G0290503 n=1 Tax=Drosophila tropicalis TaxID=46794 RepID=UPI0035AC258A
MESKITSEKTVRIKYSKESLKKKLTMEKTLSRLPSLGKTFTKSTQQGAASKKSFTLKTSTDEKRSEKSLHKNDAHKMHLDQEKVAPKSSFKIFRALESDVSQLKSSRKAKSDDPLSKHVSITPKDSIQLRLKLKKSNNKSHLKDKSLNKIRSPASLSINSRTSEKQLEIISSESQGSLTSSIFETSTASVRSERTSPGSITSLYLEMNSAKQPDQFWNILKTNQLKAVRKSKKTLSNSMNSLEQQLNILERGSKDSTESLNEFENHEGDVVSEVEDEQSKRFSFLEALRDLPDINDLSETISEDLIPSNEEDIDNPVQQHVASTDGTVSASFDARNESSEVLDTENIEYDTFIDRHSSDESSIITLDGLIESDDNDDDFVKQKNAKPLEVTFIDITNTMKELKPRNTDLVLEKIEDENMIPVVHEVAVKICHQFVNRMINYTVTYSENYTNKLRRLLDKHKLMTKLSSLIGDYQDEKLTNTRLEKIVSDYFLKKKQFSSLSHAKERDIFYETCLADALKELDRHLIAKKEIIDKHQTTTSILREKVEEARIRSTQTLYDFETLVKQTLCNRDDYDHLNQMVLNLLKQMERFRNEMYDTRFALCVAQHQFADTKSQTLKMEDLGNGLNVNEYLATQAETETLASKIAERNGDLKRLGERFNFGMHAMAHWKCKEQIFQSNLLIMKQNLRSRELAKQSKRELIYQGKLKHNKIMKEINELRSSGWLAHYPALKHDYDQTQKCVKKKKESIAKLKEELNRLEHRIEQIEKSRAC